MQKRGQKKAKPTVKRPEKKPNFICGIAIPLSQKHLNYKNIKNFSSTLRSNLAWHCSGALIFPDFSWFVKFHTLGHMVPQFAYLSIGSFLTESLSYSLLYLRSESKKHFHFDAIIAFLSRKRRPVCKR